MRRFGAVIAVAAAAACSKSEAPPPASSAVAPPPAASTDAGCRPNGQWAECSVIYRLDRAGLAPAVDSGAAPTETPLTGRRLVLKIGRTAELELFFYADTTARAADAAKLDRSQLVSGTAMQTMKRERTLIESSNVIGLLTSINAHQRERVSDALTAGPPQP